MKHSMKRTLVLASILLLGQALNWAYADTLMVEVSVRSGQHQVEKIWTVQGDFADVDDGMTEKSLDIQLWQDETLVRRYFVADPTHVHSPLLANGEEAEHDSFQLDEAIYHLRLPASDGLSHITILPVGAQHNGERALQRAPDVPLLTIDLQTY